ncbi:MAG: 5-formyltetrahydrofolate cyclo-ligase [Bacillus sp. (in: Bacteria)]|nr:5-formyltetrahydrofolate cyclo-ligase [Bacillus sp. (in: firmicutes)]
MVSKEKWRKIIVGRLKTLDGNEKLEMTKRIHNRLYEQPEWKNAKVIGTTISTQNEIDTSAIIEKAWAEGKQIVVPKCIPKKKQLIFYQISSYDELEVSYFNLREPIPHLVKEILPSEIDLLLVPGVVFEPIGYRIGHGGGYYDRFLHDRNVMTVSLCFNMQVVEGIPKEAHDIPVKKIITENGVILG